MYNYTQYIKISCLFLLCVFFLSSCSKDSISEGENTNFKTADLVDNFAYSEVEIEILTSINSYRISKGLSELDKVDIITIQAEDHTIYMVERNVVNHDNFILRYNSLVKEIGAKAVSENIGYGYGTAEGVVQAWIDSDEHRKNIEGDFTHFGISVEKDADGRNYFTNIFVKI